MSYIIICLIVSLVELYILRNTYEESKRRESRYDKWQDIPWIKGDRYKYPFWVWMIFVISFTYLIINLLFLISLFIFLMHSYQSRDFWGDCRYKSRCYLHCSIVTSFFKKLKNLLTKRF